MRKFIPKPTHCNGYLKLIVDGKIASIFPASQKTPWHDRMSRLKGFMIQPALEADYRTFRIKNRHRKSI